MPHLLNFIRGQRHPADERPHRPDLAHRDRDPDVADRRVPGSDGPAGLEQLPVLQDRTARPEPASRSRTGRRRCSTRPAGGQTDSTPEMINENGKIAPAPWVPFTRAGCDVGAVATANTVLENTAIDIPTVFGAGSPEASEVAVESAAQAFADFVGIGVHCAQGSRVCARLEPRQARPAARRAGRLLGLQRPLRREVRQSGDQSGRPDDRPRRQLDPGRERPRRLPGLRRDGGDGLARLGRADAGGRDPGHVRLHLGRPRRPRHLRNIHFAYGPGEAGYVQQLHDYDVAFRKFFDRLAARRDQQVEHAVRVHRGRGRPLRRHAAEHPELRRRHRRLHTYNRVGEINGDLGG